MLQALVACQVGGGQDSILDSIVDSLVRFVSQGPFRPRPNS